MKFIDDILNRITMYRLVLYYLMALIASATALAAFHVLAFSPFALLFSVAFATAVCWIVNELCAFIFKAQPNVESVYITAFIIALIVTPAIPSDIAHVAFLAWVCVFAMASKYILAINKKHVFNPAAFGAAFVSLTLGGAASWWVAGNVPLLPVVFLGGLLIVRKIQRADLVLTFVITTLALAAVTIPSSADRWMPVWQMMVHSSIFFFAFVMLTEPMTMPPTRSMRIVYGVLAGILFTPSVHVGTFYFTPELALIGANIFSYTASPKGRLMLKLKRIDRTSASTSEFIFTSDQKLSFKPGQYLEWTLPHKKPDTRGNRRYFTISSSPTEDTIALGVKFYNPPSSFKRALADLRQGGEVSAAQLAGEFTLPDDAKQRLVFIAGGIGITPFRSMLKYLIDVKERRDIVILYSNRRAEDIAYQPLLNQAQRELGVKIIYAVTDDPHAAQKQGYATMIDAVLVKREVPDYLNRIFYLSGPRDMVMAFEETLSKIGVPHRNIKTDFFPGFA